MQGMLINIVFTLIMVGLVLWDFISYGKEKHRDFKSIIMSAGVLGTFVGIFIGLLDFNTSDIESSVPLLLEGLKTAFYTSILGMGLAILLSIIQKSKAKKSDFENTLDYFAHQASKLDSLNDLKKLVEINQKGLDSQNKAHNEYLQFQEKNFAMLKGEFSQTNLALKEAMHHLAQGASKELISALEGVIKDFNQRITEQFGDNFKELNTAVLKLISWQESYKDTIYGIEAALKDTLEAFNVSKDTLSLIAQRNSEVLEVYNALAHSIEASRIENEKLASLLSGFESMHSNANNALSSVDSLIKSIESAQSINADFTKESMQNLTDFLKNESQKTQEYTQDSMQTLSQFLENSAQENKENAKKILEENANAFAIMQEVLQNNTQEAKNFAKDSLENIAEFLIDGSNQAKEYAQNSMQNLNDFLEKNTQEVKSALDKNTQEALNYTKNSMENLTSFLIDGNKQYRENAQELLGESNRILNEKHASFCQNLIDLQNDFSSFNTQYLQQNKENLKELLSELQNDIANFMADFDSTNAELKHKNLELLTNLKENMEKATQNVKDEFSSALTSLSDAQTQSISLLENQAKKSDEILLGYSQNIKDDFTSTSDFLQELSTKTKEHLQNNSEILQENFMQSKNELQNLSNVLETSITNTTQNLDSMLNQSAHSLKESTQEIRESLSKTSQSLSKNMQDLLENNTQYSNAIQQNLTNASQSFTNSLENMLKESQEYQTQNQNQIRQNIAETYKNALDSISAFFKNSFTNYQAQLTKASQMQFDSLHSTQEQGLALQQQMQQDLQSRLNALSEGIKEQSNKVLENMQNLTKELILSTNSQLGEHTSGMLKHFGALQNRLEKTLNDLALNYAQMLETLTKQSIEIPKDISIQLLSEFNNLQHNLGDAITKTFHSLEANRKEIDTILKITQENISHSLTQTSSLNNNLCQSLGELDNALSNITLGFRQDYEWFLRRIRELMGARN